MLTYTLGTNLSPELPISRADGHGAAIGAVVIVGALATLFPAIEIGGRIAAAAGELTANVWGFATLATLVFGLTLSRRFRVTYGALLTIGWSVATLAHFWSGGVCAAGTALALLTLGGAATAASARLD